MLKMLYQENPQSFDEVISNLASDNSLLQIGPIFEQQTKSKKSIPDLIIKQQGFSIYFETKIDDWFYSSQIKKHIEGLRSDKHTDSVVFLLGNIDPDSVEKRLQDTIDYGKNNNVIVQAISFEDFVSAFENVSMSEGLKMVFIEFQDYLDKTNLFPKWKYLLDVVNCASFVNEVRDDDVYMCPDTGGAYKHRRAKFFGPYKNKKVAEIRFIRAVVSISINQEDSNIKWNNSEENEEDLKALAISKIQGKEWRVRENSKKPYQVFILGEPYSTNFYKLSKGGLQGSKKYFKEIAKDCENPKELAMKLNNQSWEDYA